MPGSLPLVIIVWTVVVLLVGYGIGRYDGRAQESRDRD